MFLTKIFNFKLEVKLWPWVGPVHSWVSLFRSQDEVYKFLLSPFYSGNTSSTSCALCCNLQRYAQKKKGLNIVSFVVTPYWRILMIKKVKKDLLSTLLYITQFWSQKVESVWPRQWCVPSGYNEFCMLKHTVSSGRCRKCFFFSYHSFNCMWQFHLSFVKEFWNKIKIQDSSEQKKKNRLVMIWYLFKSLYKSDYMFLSIQCS